MRFGMVFLGMVLLVGVLFWLVVGWLVVLLIWETNDTWNTYS